ncbi:hypothetical protein V500_10198, partial [Pseudogymnoascus sp. VKM F-4518 (FW-2643)]
MIPHPPTSRLTQLDCAAVEARRTSNALEPRSTGSIAPSLPPSGPSAGPRPRPRALHNFRVGACGVRDDDADDSENDDDYAVTDDGTNGDFLGVASEHAIQLSLLSLKGSATLQTQKRELDSMLRCATAIADSIVVQTPRPAAIYA